MKIISNHLPSHGASPLYSWFLDLGGKEGALQNRGIRLSYGGHKLKWFVHYPGTATHFSVGNLTLSFVRCWD